MVVHWNLDAARVSPNDSKMLAMGRDEVPQVDGMWTLFVIYPTWVKELQDKCVLQHTFHTWVVLQNRPTSREISTSANKEVQISEPTWAEGLMAEF